MYVSIREYDGWENWNMIKICDYPCYNRREAELKEDEYMTELKANMNMKRASRTQEQYREDNREKIQKYFKEHRDNNKEKIQQYRGDNREKKKEKIKCECGCEVTKSNLKQHQRTQKHIDLMKCI